MPRIQQNQPTSALRRIYFVAVSIDDLQERFPGIPNADFSGRLSKNGGTSFNRSGTFVMVDDSNMPGLGYYEATLGEVDTAGTLLTAFTCFTLTIPYEMEPVEKEIEIYPAATSGDATLANQTTILADLATLLSRLSSSRAGYLDNLNVGGAVASAADIADIANDVIALLNADEHRPGRTFLGLRRRMDALCAAAASGLNGGGLAKFFQPGSGTLTEMEAVLDVVLGTRGEADVSGSEP